MIGIGAGAKAEVNLGALMGNAGHGSALDTAPPPARGEGARRPRGGALGAAAARVRRRSRCRSPRPIRSSEAEAAYERFAAGGKLGKIVLVTE